MNNENNQKPSEVNRGDSDFEFLNTSDSELDIDGNHQKPKITTIQSGESYVGNIDSIISKIENVQFPIVNKTENNLKFSTEKIAFTSFSKSNNRSEVGNVLDKQLTSIPKNFGQRLARNGVRDSVPEIVLSSFESTEKNNQLTLNTDVETSPNLHFLRDKNSPSPEFYLDSQLSAASSLSNQSSRSCSPSGFYNDNLTSSFASKIVNSGSTINTHRPSSSMSTEQASTTTAVTVDSTKCHLCSRTFKDPRTLDCLHSFCHQCLVDENFKQDSSIPFWSQPNEINNFEWKSTKSNYSIKSLSAESGENGLSPPTSQQNNPRESRSSFSSLKSRKSLDKTMFKDKPRKVTLVTAHSNSLTGKSRVIYCPICQYATELPVGGIRQLPINFLLVRKIEAIKFNLGNSVMSKMWCSLCSQESVATYHCVTCTLNLCTFCKDAHERQRSTANHKIKNIIELRKARKTQKATFDEQRYNIKCSMHPGFEVKSFCHTCIQIICSDCLILLHKGHKHEPISKAYPMYQKMLKDSTERTKPLCEFTEHSISRLNEISKKINNKCNQVHTDVENFMISYFEAVEVHAKTLAQQITRARDTKMQMILQQQLDMEKRSQDAEMAVRFSHELMEKGSDVEILSFLNILLKRFEYCHKFEPPLDPKISETLQFLPEIRAPSTKAQNNIPLFGIITTQTVEPQFCTLETGEVYSELRVHKKIELTMLSRDADGIPLCHGGLQLTALLKYKEGPSKLVPVEINDKRDGTYGVSFIPDCPGSMSLSITINEKPIKGSPFTLQARNVRPHSGIYHCCSFCSSKATKVTTCACEGTMPTFNGCGHGHNGHPGRRHWSCCGNLLENSECTTANKLLNLI